MSLFNIYSGANIIFILLVLIIFNEKTLGWKLLFTPSVSKSVFIRYPLNHWMALDYNNPIVAEEFNLLKHMTYEEVESELLLSGVRGSPNMNEIDLKFMLVELRMRLAGKMPGQKSKKKKKPNTFSNKFEEALWTKPSFAELYESLSDDQNSKNVAVEFLNNPDIARQRYGKHYEELISKIETSLSSVASVKSPTILFSGFPANMGKTGCKMSLESLGPLAEFQCIEDTDFLTLSGKVTFEDIETAKRAIKQYDGIDMGMGQKLEFTPA